MPLDTNRYRSRLKPFNGVVTLDIGGGDEIGIWDTIEKRFLDENEIKAAASASPAQTSHPKAT
jgi:hypothetical protein